MVALVLFLYAMHLINIFAFTLPKSRDAIGSIETTSVIWNLLVQIFVGTSDPPASVAGARLLVVA